MNRPANRRELLTYINHVSFAVDEAKLYLDTPLRQESTFIFSGNESETERGLKRIRFGIRTSHH